MLIAILIGIGIPVFVLCSSLLGREDTRSDADMYFGE